MNPQTFVTFWPKIAGGDVTKVVITKQKSDEMFIFAHNM